MRDKQEHPMHGILPVEMKRTTARAQFIANPLLPRAAENTEKVAYSIRTLLFTHGFGKTLEYFCTFSVFSVLSVD
jgi:hypothetical protein